MFARRLFLLLTAFTVVLMSAAVGYAEEDASLLQVCPWEQYMDIYVSGDFDPENVTCRISNQAAEVTDSGLLADGGVTVRTTILLDISQSIPEAVRGSVRSYIDTLIQTISAKEQYKIVTFGEQMTVLQDYTNDRYDLAVAADKIEFNSRKSMIYDAIYNTIPGLEPLDGAPCYYRTIIITDGADDTETGVTKEELYLKLQSDTYPIDVIAVSGSKQQKEVKELAALVRISGGRYAGLSPESDIEELSSRTAVEDIVWLRTRIPGPLLDGSTRQIDLSDGITSMQFDTKVPVFEVPETESSARTESAPQEEPSVEETGTEAEQTTNAARKASDDSPEATVSAEAPVSAAAENQKEGGGASADYSVVIAVGAGALAVIIAAVIIASAAVRKHKKKRNGGEKRPDASSTSDHGDNLTEILLPVDGASDGSENGTLCVRLRSTLAPDREWTFSLKTPIVIGRVTDCQVCLDDKSVSRNQCRLYLENGGLMVENLSHSNITQLNGSRLTSSQPIKEGDRLKCGRVTVTVDSLYKSGSDNTGRLNKLTDFVNV